MNIKSEKLRNGMLMLTLILVTIALMADMVIIPVAENLFGEFGDVSVAVLNFILTGPALIGAFSGLAFGKLMQYISKKKLLIIAFAIFSTGAIFGYAVHSAYFMAAMRVLVGIGMGSLGVISMAIIADIFNDESKRSSMLGIFNGGMAAVGAAIGWISGFVATLGWTMVFRIYLVAIPILIMIFLFVPADEVTAPVAESKDDVGSSDEKMPWVKVIALGVAFLIFSAIYCIVFYKISMIVAEKAIGDVTFIGMISALGTVGSFVACFLFGKTYGFFKRSTPIVAYTVMALSFAMLYFSSSSIVAAIACTLLGAMYGMGMSYYFMHCTMIVPESRIPMSIGFTSFCMSIGTFLSVYVATFLQGAIGVTTITEIMPVLIVILAVGAALSAVFTVKDRKTGLVPSPEPELSE